jgi:hypothetical protein
MNPITETYQILILFSNTAKISATTTTVATNTYATIGEIYLPYPHAIFDPIAVLASMLLFLLVGMGIKKPTSFAILWIGLLFSGVLSQGQYQGVYWAFALFAILTTFIIYQFFKNIQDE